MRGQILLLFVGFVCLFVSVRKIKPIRFYYFSEIPKLISGEIQVRTNVS